ncbi:hypothetical protein Tco_0607859 [Tanacetum coccineum]
MSTPVFVDPKSSTQADGAQSSRVLTPFPEDPYEAVRQACLVETDTESEPFEDPIDTETPESPHYVASPTPLPDSTPPTCHTKESESSDTSGARSTSSDSTAPLSPDHPLTHTSPTPTPTRASFHHNCSYDCACPAPHVPWYQGTSELILDTDSEEDEIGEEDTNEDEGRGLDDEGHGLDNEGHGLDDEGHGLDDEGRSVESDGLSLKGEEETIPEGQQRAVFRYPEEEDGITYIDIPAYPPPAPPAKIPLSPECSPGSLPVSPAPSVVPSPISSPMISLTVPSPIASPVATPTATILIDEDQFIEIGAQLELYGGILQDHTQRLDAMLVTP